MDKIIAKDQATLVNKSLEKAVKLGLKEWSVTADGTAVNVSIFQILKCKFSGFYHKIQSSFILPTAGEDDSVCKIIILDPCRMLKLARNAIAQTWFL